MLIVRVLSAFAKPALAGSVLTAGAVGGFFAFNHFDGNSHDRIRGVQGDGPRLVVSAFADSHDNIIAVDPDNVSDRTTIARSTTRPGYGIFATLAPDGHALAYTALPPDTAKPTPDAPAQAAIVDDRRQDDAARRRRRPADRARLGARRRSRSSSARTRRRRTAPAPSSCCASARDGSRTTLTTWHTAAIFPIAFAPDGSKLYFATLNAHGSDLYSVAPDGSGETKVAHLSDEITRDWTLSPDGAQLAYSVAVSGNTPRLVTQTLTSHRRGVRRDARRARRSAQFNPAWKADGELTVGAVKPQGGGDAVTRAAARRHVEAHAEQRTRWTCRSPGRPTATSWRCAPCRARRRSTPAQRTSTWSMRTAPGSACRIAPMCWLWGGCDEARCVHPASARSSARSVAFAAGAPAGARAPAPAPSRPRRRRTRRRRTAASTCRRWTSPATTCSSPATLLLAAQHADRHAHEPHDDHIALRPADAAEGDQLDRKRHDAGRLRRCRSAPSVRRWSRSTAATASRRSRAA